MAFFPQWGLQVKEEKHAHGHTSFFWWSNTTTSRPLEAKESWNLIQNTAVINQLRKTTIHFLYFCFKQQQSKGTNKTSFCNCRIIKVEGDLSMSPSSISQSELAQGSVLLSFECLSMDEHPIISSASFQCPTTLMEELPLVYTHLPPLTKKTLMITSLYLVSVKKVN